MKQTILANARTLTLKAACTWKVACMVSCALAFVALQVAPAAALEITDRQVDLGKELSVTNAQKVMSQLIGLDTRGHAPIYLLIATTRGSAQGVMMVSDTIRSLRSPVVGVVLTQVHGAGAAVAVLTDRLVLYPSAGLVFTELEYEGVKKPEPPKEKKEAAPAEPEGPGVDASKSGGGEKPEQAVSGGKRDNDTKDEPTPEEKLLQQARAAFLARYEETIAKRLNMKVEYYRQRIAEGGFVMSPADAVKQKVAYETIERINFTDLPETKREVKVITSDKTTRAIDVEADKP